MADWSKCDIAQLRDERDSYARIACRQLMAGASTAQWYLNEFAAIEREIAKRSAIDTAYMIESAPGYDVNGDDATTRYEQEPGAAPLDLDVNGDDPTTRYEQEPSA